MTEQDTDWLTAAQAAELTGYHINHVRRLLQVGEVEGRKFGPTWMVSRDSLQAYLSRLANRPHKRGRKPGRKPSI